jgi:hypothetical protein
MCDEKRKDGQLLKNFWLELVGEIQVLFPESPTGVKSSPVFPPLVNAATIHLET